LKKIPLDDAELFRSLWQQRKQEEQEINFRDRQEIKELARCV
jgi:DNA-binding MltR family transcriptional regulator